MKSGTHKILGPALAAAVLMGSATSFAKISGSTPLTAEQYQKILGRGLAVSWYKNKWSEKSQGDDYKDFRARGFDHVRLRVDAGVFKGSGFDRMEDEINRCISEDLIPVISWINHPAEGSASAQDKAEYVAWWKDLAQRFKGQHLVGFNLFTEVNKSKKLWLNDLYNPWMEAASEAIRSVDPNRIIILGAPNKTHKTLHLIDPAIYKNDDYMMVEWHLYASGPTQDGGQKNWNGNGSEQDRRNLTEPLDEGVQFTKDTGLECYFGAWMPMDNTAGSLNQTEVENFTRFFTLECAERGIPWGLNADQHFYDAKKDQWLGVAKTTPTQLNMPPILDIMLTVGEYGEGVDTDLGGVTPPVNEAPAFADSAINAADALEATAYAGSIAGSASDPEGDALTYSKVAGPAWLSVDVDGALSGTPGAADVGANSWTVQVAAEGGSDTATLNIDVAGKDTPPVDPLTVNAGDDVVVDADDSNTATVTLTAVGTGDIVDYVWKNGALRVGEGETITVTLPEGESTLVVRVKDPAGNIVRDEVVVTVNPYVPTIDPNNTTPVFKKSVVLTTKAKIGKSINKDISKKAKDADGDKLTFSKTDGPDWLNVSEAGKLSGTPSSGDKGNNIFTIEVSDGQASDTATVKIKVK